MSLKRQKETKTVCTTEMFESTLLKLINSFNREQFIMFQGIADLFITDNCINLMLLPHKLKHKHQNIEV